MIQGGQCATTAVVPPDTIAHWAVVSTFVQVHVLMPRCGGIV